MAPAVVLQFGQASHREPSGDAWLFAAAFLVLLVQLIVTVVWFVRGRAKLIYPRPTMPRRAPVTGTDFVEMGGRRFYLTDFDHDSKAWLLEIVANRTANPAKRAIPLVTYRAQFRSLIRLRLVGCLVSCLLEPDPELRRLAIWLLSHCGASSSVTALCVLQSSRSPAIRRQVGLALKRMRKVAELQRMVRDTDPRIRRIANSHQRLNQRSYSDRLQNYVEHSGGTRTDRVKFESQMALFVDPSVGQGKPANTRQWIRRLLEHIRELVRRSSRGREAQ